jgi:hypothetical protein
VTHVEDRLTAALAARAHQVQEVVVEELPAEDPLRGVTDLDAAAGSRLPRLLRPARPTAHRWAGAAAVAAAVAALVAVGGPGPVPAGPVPTPPPRGPTPSATPPQAPADVLSVLTRPAGALDALPATPGVAGPPALRPGTARALAQTPVARYWAAVDPHGRVCLVTLLRSTAPVWGEGCAPVADFAGWGTSSTSASGVMISTAWLVPDSFDRGALLDGGYTAVGPNLLVLGADLGTGASTGAAPSASAATTQGG